MPQYDSYEAYREPLTEEELARIGKAKQEPKGENAALDPVTAAYVAIAMERAEKQFALWPVLPEDSSVAESFPGIDPEGKFSAIDMKIAQRMAQIHANLESRHGAVAGYVKLLLEKSGEKSPVQEIRDRMESLAKEHRKVTRAAKLCHDQKGREYLSGQALALETDPAVEQMDLYLQGLEYAAGVRTGPVPETVKEFYQKNMGLALDEGMIRGAQDVSKAPDKIKVEFQNLDNRYRQAAFANPRNWGKSPTELEKGGFVLAEAGNMIPPYVRATANRVIDPLFEGLEKMDNLHVFSRGDYIIIDGKTIRERMYEAYTASGEDSSVFGKFYVKNVKQMAGDYVAAALMSGKRVEAFVPDKDGKIPAEPTQITKTGYEPTPMNPVVLSGWERFWSKLGFYKEKVVAAEEYSRAAEARERVKSINAEAKLTANGIAQAHIKERFFGNRLKEKGSLPENVPNGYTVSRSALTTTVVCAMLKAGFTMEEIFDPKQRQADKLKMGDMVLSRMETGDQEWMGEVLFHGQRLLADYLDDAAKKIDVFDQRELFKEDRNILFFAASVAFDASQEREKCKEEYLAAAEKYRPQNGKALVTEVDDRANVLAVFYSKAEKSLKARNLLLGGMVGAQEDAGVTMELLEFEAARKLFSDRKAEKPGVPMSQLANYAEVSMGVLSFGALVRTKPGFQAFTSMMENKTAQRALGKALLSGEAQKSMKLTIDPGGTNSNFEIKAPSKNAAKQTNATEKKTPQKGVGR